MWQLKDTLWIKKLHLPVTIDSFLDGVDLNIDRASLNFSTGKLIDRGCRHALARKTITIDSRVRLDELLYDEYARALLASRKLGFALDKDLMEKIKAADSVLLRRRAFERLRSDGYRDRDIMEALAAI